MIVKMCIVATIVMVAFAPAVNWKSEDSSAKISFTVKGPFGTVNGKFTGLKTTIQFDEKNPGSGSITASVDATSVSTGSGIRNGHLRKKEEWFDTEKYPRISFSSKKIEKTVKGYTATGVLTIKNVSKSIQLSFSFTPKGDEGIFKGQFIINRTDYHLGKEGGSVGPQVTITLEVPVKK